MKLCIENFTPLFIIVVILLGGCSGCGQKTAPNTPLEAQRKFANTPNTQLSSGETQPSIDPILDVELQEIELPPDFNGYYGKSYFGITENNQVPPVPDKFYADPLFWIPGFEIVTEHYLNGESESFLVLPDNDEKSARYKERLAALEMEQGTLTIDDYRRISAEVKSEGLSYLHAAKYLGSYQNPYAIEFAEKAHEENPDDFHTLWVLASLQKQQYKHTSGPDVPHNKRTVASYRRLIEMNSRVARVWYEFGIIAPTRDESVAAYRKSFELDPTLYYGESLVRLAQCHALWAPETAVAYLKQWNVIFPNEHALFLIEGIEKEGGWRVGHGSWMDYH